jgi:hypothetical protein
MGDEGTTKTPNQELAEEVADALMAAGLVPPGWLRSLRQQLAAGVLKEQDWVVLIETAIPKLEES